MARTKKTKPKRGNPDLYKYAKPFVKGDPRINRKGAPKRLPALKALMDELLGIKEGEDITKSEMALVIKALVSESKSKKQSAQKVAAAKELLDRAFGKPKQVVEVAEEKPLVWNEIKTYEK